MPNVDAQCWRHGDQAAGGEGRQVCVCEEGTFFFLYQYRDLRLYILLACGVNMLLLGAKLYLENTSATDGTRTLNLGPLLS